MAELKIDKARFFTYEQGGETKLGVEQYDTADQTDLKASVDLGETQAQSLRDFLATEYP